MEELPKTKKCSKCQEVKGFVEFNKCKTTIDGFCYKCRKCHNKDNLKHYYDNIEHRKQVSQNWKEKNKENSLAKAREYKKTHKNEINQRRRERRKEDPEYKIEGNLRARMLTVIKESKTKKCDNTMRLIGCSPSFLIEYLESQFTDGMTWENHGYKGWHIDHIKPCCSFDLTNSAAQLECFHYTNLRPLWYEDHITKFKSDREQSIRNK